MDEKEWESFRERETEIKRWGLFEREGEREGEREERSFIFLTV